MANPEHVEIVRSGAKLLKTWRIQNPDQALNLFEADLADADLRGANLIDVDMTGANLSRADLSGAYLSGARLNDVNLTQARLNRARLIGSRLTRANLTAANLTKANLRHANLTSASLVRAVLAGVKLRGADLRGADCTEAILTGAKLIRNDFQEVVFHRAVFGFTVFADGDLSQAEGLESVEHRGPSSVGVDTLSNSRGQLPKAFLVGCGFAPWQVMEAKLYQPDLTSQQIREVQEQVLRVRLEQPTRVGGVFLSHDRADGAFADQLRQRFLREGICCWKDPHDAAAGQFKLRLSQQTGERMLREHDVVVLVLSSASLAGEWVEHELDSARHREKRVKRDLLFPVALDDAWQSRLVDTSWKAKLEDLLWRQNKTKLVVDCTDWESERFESQFQTLLSGLQLPQQTVADAV